MSTNPAYFVIREMSRHGALVWLYFGYMKSTKAHLHTDRKFYILVAHRSGAYLFSKSKMNSSPKCIETFEHPEGRLKNQEIDADKPGRTYDSFGKGRHGYMRRNDPTTQKAKEFSKTLVTALEKYLKRGDFEQLILIAPANFLGLINSGMSKKLKEVCDATFTKDFADLKLNEVSKRVDGLTQSLFPLYKDMPLRASR